METVIYEGIPDYVAVAEWRYRRFLRGLGTWDDSQTAKDHCGLQAIPYQDPQPMSF